jgi:nitroimidazol reductase NimA-like FMN-containing flavoprotein (pyridoxamine 5'-phosphate oxidase superfamily)
MKDYATLPPTATRRPDRAVEDEVWIKALLRRAPVGVLALSFDGQPFVNTNLFVYDEAAHAIYMHTARTGRTRAAVEANPRVCFTVSEMGRLLPASEAGGFSVEYASVILFGRGGIIADRAQAKDALQLLLEKYFPHLKPDHDYQPITLNELKRTSVYRIDIEQWSGKQKKADDDFPGAFLYGSAGA